MPCNIDFESDTYPEFFCRTKRTARKQHTCCECQCVINIGNKYEHISGMWENHIERYHTCALCSEIRATYLGNQGNITELWDNLYECEREKDIGYETIDKLSPEALEKYETKMQFLWDRMDEEEEDE